MQNGWREKAAAHIIILLNVQEGQFSHRWLPIWSFTPTICLKRLLRNMIWNNTFEAETLCRHQITKTFNAESPEGCTIRCNGSDKDYISGISFSIPSDVSLKHSHKWKPLYTKIDGKISKRKIKYPITMEWILFYYRI